MGFQSIVRSYSLSIAILLVIYFLAINEQLAKLCAGVAILLFGMMFLSEGFKSFSGGFLERALTNFTKTSFRSVVFGTIVTSIMQSSSLVSVLSISFVSASLISLVQGIGVIFGANLGNTAGSWLIAGASSINISSLALPLIVGGLLFSAQSSRVTKGIGKILAGLGFFFLGVFFIKMGFEQFKSIIDLSQYKLDKGGVVIGFLLIGTLATSIIQSSHATLAIIITAFVESQIGYKEALAATLGTSVGGVVTALIASLSASIDGKRLAIANCIFNFLTAILVLLLFEYFVTLNDFIAKHIGISEHSILKLALFHTLFNVFGIIIFIAFIPYTARILNKFIVSKDSKETRPKFLNDQILHYKDTALHALDGEVRHLYDNGFEIISHTIGFHRRDIRSNKSIEKLVLNRDWFKTDIDIQDFYTKQIKILFNAIMDFSTKLQTIVQDSKDMQKIVSFQIASRKIAEATKSVYLLQKNMKRIQNSNNKHLRLQYDSIRISLATLLRMIEDVNNIGDIENVAKNLDNQKKLFKIRDREAFNIVKHLIDKELIASKEGTSLLNDVGIARTLAKELISAVKHIYGLNNASTLS